MASSIQQDFQQKTLKAKIPKDNGSNEDILVHLIKIQALVEDTSLLDPRGNYKTLYYKSLENEVCSSLQILEGLIAVV